VCTRPVNAVDGGHMSIYKTPNLRVSDCGFNFANMSVYIKLT